MEKSHVGMGHSVCPVCGVEHDEVVLIDLRLKQTLERDNFTGFALCPEHKQKHTEGYVALVVVSYVKEGVPFIEQFNSAKRTGEMIHMKYEAAQRIFNVPIKRTMEMLWIDPEAAEKIKGMMPKEADRASL